MDMLREEKVQMRGTWTKLPKPLLLRTKRCKLVYEIANKNKEVTELEP